MRHENTRRGHGPLGPLGGPDAFSQVGSSDVESMFRKVDPKLNICLALFQIARTVETRYAETDAMREDSKNAS